MAIFRKVHTSFWSDPFVGELTPEQKYFYLYLITNEHTRQCGIYEMTIRQICFNTGYNTDTVYKLINFFIEAKKLIHSEKSNEFAILNWLKYNDSTSPKVKTCIHNELKTVKNRDLIQYLYSMDTHSQEEVEEEPEREVEVEQKTTTVQDDIFKAMKSFRPDVPDKVMEKERNKFEIRYPGKNIKKDIKLIQTWSENINFTPKETRKNEFDETAKRNKEKYGS